ncbi:MULTISPECIES: PQQ-binding-like beta-propeller repeat protein [unclassified Flavobacterium]|uniref:outer membrane protein assembly factor BamB family protein n=1 Tax=unclassified Flavobacterium TaxID=196869 RepID=UPI000E313A0E|nr:MULTISPECIES: PQQ-binding-like beta-propeller repeat protein [unclassified Flavobacterium]QKJ61856.1 PQQ-binding-like beta-propeller repeat protein [Flavobacterium sp. M31R6]
MKKIKFSMLLLLLVSISAFAQRNYDEVIKTDGTIKDLVQNEITGIIVFIGNGKISGIDAETKKIVWTLTKEDYGNATTMELLGDGDLDKMFAEKKELKSVPNSPYVEAYVNSKFIIIKTDTGKIVYNSSKESFWVVQSDFLAETNEYLLTLREKGEMHIALIDLESGNIKWKTPVDKSKSFFSLSLKSLINKAQVNGATIYYLLYGKLYSFNRETGKLNWKAEEEYTKFFPTQNDNNIVVINSAGTFSSKEYINVLSTDTGKSIWKESIKTKYVVYLEDWGTKLLIAHYSGFNFFDLKTGEKIWKKDARGDGLKKVIPIDKDFLYVAENEMMLINKDGEKLWKNFIEIADDKEDPIFYLGKVGEKVMYLTGTYGNMVDYKSGKKLWKRNIKFNKDRPVLPTFDEATNSYLVYNDEKLYKFNPSIDDKPEPFAEVNIKREKELNSIEMFPWGVALSGPVEVMGVALDGTVKYHNTYNQPGETGRQFLKGAAMVGSFALGATSVAKGIQGSEWTMTTRDADGNETTSVVKSKNKAQLNQSMAAAAGADALAMVAARFGSRFNAMKQNRDFSYIFAKTETGEKMLVKVRKADGVEVDKVTFKNNHPVYEIDPATQNIFYVLDDSIEIFNKK